MFLSVISTLHFLESLFKPAYQLFADAFDYPHHIDCLQLPTHYPTLRDGRIETEPRGILCEKIQLSVNCVFIDASMQTVIGIP